MEVGKRGEMIVPTIKIKKERLREDFASPTPVLMTCPPLWAPGATPAAAPSLQNRRVGRGDRAAGWTSPQASDENATCHLLAVWSWARHHTSLGLLFLICETGILMSVSRLLVLRTEGAGGSTEL